MKTLSLALQSCSKVQSAAFEYIFKNCKKLQGSSIKAKQINSEDTALCSMMEIISKVLIIGPQ